MVLAIAFVFAVVAFVAGSLVYGRIKYGSWAGALVKAAIERTVGTVKPASLMASVTFDICKLHVSNSGDKAVALVVKTRAPFSVSIQAYKLSATQAIELATYLTQASGQRT